MEIPETKTNRINAFDSIRGIASLLIVFKHLEILNIGWVGVPIFFVFSGYLITDILIKNINSPNYFRAFYFRRSLRIFPIYYIALVISLLYGILYKMDVLSWDTYIYALYLQNYNWGNHNFPWFFNHTWSLAIEEQFYLLWPLLFLLFYKRNKINYLIFLLLVISVFCKYLFIKDHLFSTNYTSTISNFDTLLFGCLFAVNKDLIKNLINKFSIHFLWFTFTLAVSILILVSNLFPIIEIGNIESTLITYLTIVISIAVISITNHIQYVGSRSLFKLLLFENPVFIYLGKISYGLYLYHYIFLAIAANKLIEISKFLVGENHIFVSNFLGLFFSILIAFISWELIEKPILKLKDKISYS